MSDIVWRENVDHIDHCRLTMNTSDGSDDEKSSVEGQSSKLKIADVLICRVLSKQNCQLLYDYRWQKTMNILPRKKIRKQKKQKQKQFQSQNHL